ncbi:hypothetical protein F5B18DRAFT_656607 [Nemania serpens]|nr:hypothetical protein F5B18DRAFT_656607 [Nemania serpens]
MAYQSLFSYNIQRPYPYRWFTPAATVGGIAALVLLSFINITSSGYNLAVLYSSDLNATVAENWYKNLPQLLDHGVKPSCEPKIMLTNEAFRTNNSALTYILNEVTLDTSGSAKFDEPVAALIYTNNYLGDCAVHETQVLLSSADRTAVQYGYTPWGATVQSRASCILSLGKAPMKINLTATYNLIPETVSTKSGLTVFDGLNRTATPSLYWAESLLANNWENLTDTLKEQRPFPQTSKITISFTHSTLTKDVASLDYFLADLRALTLETDPPLIYTTSDNETTKLVINNYGNFVIAADSLAKVMEATIMSDLGQT